MDVVGRHNIKFSGPSDGRVMLFAHGFGCDQHMWRLVAPAFAEEYRVVLFDHVGAGGSDPDGYNLHRHSSLAGYADDVLDIIGELDLREVVFVGHSVSAMIGVLAAARQPGRFAALVLVAPSPRYVNDVDYVGGFDATDIDELLASLESNYLGWSSAMAPVIMGVPDRPELGAELAASFCRSDPEIARRFASVTFRSDSRADLPRVATPTLVLQCSNDVIAPICVGEYVRDAMPNATMVLLEATGHCPNLSAPNETIEAMRQFLVPMAAGL